MPTEEVTCEIQVYRKRRRRPDLYHFKTFTMPVNSPQNMTKEIRFLEDMSYTAWDVMNVTIVPVIEEYRWDVTNVTMVQVIEEYRGKPATMIYQTVRVPSPRIKVSETVEMNSIVRISCRDGDDMFWELLTPETAVRICFHAYTQLHILSVSDCLVIRCGD
ncbi:hypothetical protein GCK32_019035 [Trichostrongylus colubriformis]|uniref:Uncharacterized protein n=1 Tax=Trichostrongylus colubriformis TaxID=6319 RepID=A0AAN8ICD1_TRICO